MARVLVRLVLALQLAAVVVLLGLLGVRVGSLLDRTSRIVSAQEDILVALEGLDELEKTAATVDSLRAIAADTAGLTDTIAGNTGRIASGVGKLAGSTKSVEANVTQLRSAAEPLLAVLERVEARRANR